MNHHLRANFTMVFTIVFGALLALPACSVNVKKEANGQDKKVDIETPFGGIHVNKDADVRDTGLAVYPGAHPVEKEDDGNEKSANVNLSAGPFGIKVVAVEYKSDAPPDKIIAFYKDQLKKYGTVLECRTTYHPDSSVDIHEGDDHKSGHESNQLSCDSDTDGHDLELKVGTKENQRIVAVQRKDDGARFALVLVQMHGKDTI